MRRAKGFHVDEPLAEIGGEKLVGPGKTLPPAEVTAWASGAFTTADADKSISVSKPELISYLSGSAGA